VASSSKNKCVICKHNDIKSRYWIYVWKGKDGYACETCGRWFHDVGGYLISKAVEILKEQGVGVTDCKEKFGRWRLSCYGKTKKHQKQIRKLHMLYEVLFGEFSWDFY
jgi:transposase-like protein